MTHQTRLFVPAITPFRADLSVDTARFVAHCRLLLGDGADGLAPFGTTSEATSMSVAERMSALDALVDAGIPAARLIPGTGCSALPDSIALTRHALAHGVRGTLTLPPFFYKPVSPDGLFASYARLIEAVGSDSLRLYLYHIPQMTGVGITLDLIGRLTSEFPGIVAGLKDSSGNWENTAAVIAAFPEIETYSASESLLVRNVAAGGAGCISASANVNVAGIMALIRALGTPVEAARLEAVGVIRALFEQVPLIPAIKATVARRLSDPDYAITRPPLMRLDASHDAAILRACALCFGGNTP
ncbi:MAG: dihydrodipicolinate synthase family protein [Pseudomonadota bacterium]